MYFLSSGVKGLNDTRASSEHASTWWKQLIEGTTLGYYQHQIEVLYQVVPGRYNTQGHGIWPSMWTEPVWSLSLIFMNLEHFGL